MSTQLTLPQAPRMSLVDSTIDLIRSQVESGAWKVGERIPKEAELADMLQVGRNTVREAIRVLSHARVLEVRQGDGTYVRSTVDPGEIMRRIGRSSLRDHFELRAILEMGAARLAAERRTDEDLERLDRLLVERGEMPSDGDLTTFAQRDVAFHTAIARASHNAGLEELYRYFATSARLHTHALMLELERDVPGADAEAHANILSAIERRDPDQAAKAVQDTMTSIMMRLAELDRP